jgi:hypothetical protein
MVPPKPNLSWQDVTNLDFLCNIETLCGHDDVRQQPWAQEVFRKAIRVWSKLHRAQEELEAIGVEILRLQTSMRDEEEHFRLTLAFVQQTNPGLASYMTQTFAARLNANNHVRSKLVKIQQHSCFEGPYGFGVALDPWSQTPLSTDLLDTFQGTTMRPIIHPTSEETLDLSSNKDSDRESEMSEDHDSIIDELIEVLRADMDD